MLGKSWKHLSFIIRIFCLITISGTTYYLGCDSPQKNADPVKIYRVTEPAKKDANSTTESSLPPVSIETTDVDTPEKSVSSLSEDKVPKNENLTEALDEFAQRLSDSDRSEQVDKGLAEKKSEILDEIDRLNSSISEIQQEREDLVASFNRVMEENDQRLYTLAKKLNSFSPEEQLAYFEEYRREKVDVEEFFNSAIAERARTEAAARGYSEQMEIVLDQIRQTIQKTTQEITDEERVNEHMARLRKYGFKPKF